MTRKKKPSNAIECIANTPAQKVSSTPAPHTVPPPIEAQPKNKNNNADPSTSALIICRNKHWRCPYRHICLYRSLLEIQIFLVFTGLGYNYRQRFSSRLLIAIMNPLVPAPLTLLSSLTWSRFDVWSKKRPIWPSARPMAPHRLQ